MAYSEWYQGYLRQEQEEALRRERGASRQHATFAQRPPAPRPAPPRRPPTVQEQLAALSTVIYAARQSTANREAFEARMTKEVLAQPFRLNGDSIYKRRAAEVQAHRLAASQGLPKQPEKQGVPVMPSADEVYRRRKMEAQRVA